MLIEAVKNGRKTRHTADLAVNIHAEDSVMFQLKGDDRLLSKIAKDFEGAEEIVSAEEKQDLDRYMDRADHWRKTYYRAYTGRELGAYRDYDISIDIGRLGFDKTAKLLTGLLKDMM